MKSLFLAATLALVPVDVFAQAASTCAPQIVSQTISGINEKVDDYHLNVSLGCMSKEKFDALQKAFGSSMTTPFDSNTNYNLKEFLPNFLKKVIGKHLVPHEIVVPDLVYGEVSALGEVDKMAKVDSNCHSVAWQWINHAQGQKSDDFIFALVDGDSLLGFAQSAPAISQSQLQIGDVVMVEGNTLQQQGAALHSAIYIGEGLVFEKGNPGENYPYRVAKLKDVISKYETAVEGAIFHFRRPSQISKMPLLADDMGLGNPTQLLDNGIKFSNVSSQQKKQYSLVYEFDRSTMDGIYLFARLLSSSEVDPSKLVEIKK